MPTYKNTNYSLIYVVIAIVFIGCLSIAGPLIIRPFTDNLAGSITLREFETEFQDVQHPTGTERLSLRTAMGDFNDSEQGCDFFVGEVRRYGGNEEIILAAYAYQAVIGNPIQVVFIEGEEIPAGVSDSLPKPLNDLAEWELPSDARRQWLYIVYLLVIDYEGDLQVDCR
jgi:hypothetical protein